ncbi:hypothetical protein IJF86_02055 [Candidatus Saccharibacteria bacterium]|nr:hypothetical protein [Candidatus Saccharibacteria bacterium]
MRKKFLGLSLILFICLVFSSAAFAKTKPTITFTHGATRTVTFYAAGYSVGVTSNNTDDSSLTLSLLENDGIANLDTVHKIIIPLALGTFKIRACSPETENFIQTCATQTFTINPIIIGQVVGDMDYEIDNGATTVYTINDTPIPTTLGELLSIGDFLDADFNIVPESSAISRIIDSTATSKIVSVRATSPDGLGSSSTCHIEGVYCIRNQYNMYRVDVSVVNTINFQTEPIAQTATSTEIQSPENAPVITAPDTGKPENLISVSPNSLLFLFFLTNIASIIIVRQNRRSSVL